jgi:fructokinase
MAELWGIDLGGTKIEGVILDPVIGPEKPICRLRVDTESEKGFEHVYGQIHRVCQMLSDKSGRPIPARVGMGTPGVADPTTGRLKNSNSQCLNGRRLEEEIEGLTGIDFVLANDANLLALAETTFGCARGFPTVFGVILGTGVGGGIIAHGKILEGRHGIAGEWGQVTLDPNEQASVYGTRGTIEAILCGPGLEAFYERATGQRKKLKEIAATTVIDILDPHAIVLGGGVGNIDALYTPAMLEKIRTRIFNPTFEAALLKPTLGDSAGVFGAAMLVA